jgi:drug/metabolite transporter (DMT)-like permease
LLNRGSHEAQASHTATYLMLVALVIIWASNFSVVKYALREFVPLAFNGLRFALASLFLAAGFVLARRAPRIERRHWPALIGLGLLGNTFYQILFIYGIHWTLAGNASLMLATTPIITTILSAAFRQERAGALAWSGVILSFVGVALVVWGSTRAIAFGAETVRGDLTTLAAALAWSSYTVGSSPLVRRYGSLPITAITMWVGSLGLVLVSLPAFLAQDWGAVRAPAWLALLFSASLAIALAYLIWYHSVGKLGNTRTAVYTNSIPLVALGIAWLTLGEVPGSLQVAGAAGIVGGALLVRLGPIQRAEIRPPAE